MYKALRIYLGPLIRDIFNCAIRLQKVAAYWRKGEIANIHKSGSKLNPANYRGIILLCILGKLFNTIMSNRIMKYCADRRILCDHQDGFILERGCMGHVFSLTEIVIDMVNNSRRPYVFFLDLSKAFDRLNRKLIYKKLREAGIPRNIVNLIADMYRKTTVRYRTKFGNTDLIRTLFGVPQGDPLSPIIFDIVIDPMLRQLQKSGICYRFLRRPGTECQWMYADDFACICDSAKDLQKAINICKDCVDFFQLKANVKKSAVMLFYGSPQESKPTETFTWGTKGPKLEITDSYPYLGVAISKHIFDWSEHYEKLDKKERAAFAKNHTFYTDIYTRPVCKLDMFKSKQDSVNKYACDIITPPSGEHERMDKRQMSRVKTMWGLNKQCTNTIIRLMGDFRKFDTFQNTQTVNSLRKNLQKVEKWRYPRQICEAWKEDDMMKGPIISNSKRCWNKYQAMIVNSTSGAVKNISETWKGRPCRPLFRQKHDFVVQRETIKDAKPHNESSSNPSQRKS